MADLEFLKVYWKQYVLLEKKDAGYIRIYNNTSQKLCCIFQSFYLDVPDYLQ